MKKIILSLSAAALMVGSLHANDKMFSEYAVAAKAGTLGVGVEVTTNITENINARVSLSGFNYSKSQSEEEINYDADLSILNIALLADYYAFSSSQFRFTGGLMYNGNKLDMNGKPTGTGTFTINDVVYNSSDVSSVDASVDYKNIAPYIGIGWGNAIQSAGWNFTADLGIMYQGSADVGVSYDSSLTGAAKDALDANIAQEQKDLEDDLSSLKIYPVVTVGISYRF